MNAATATSHPTSFKVIAILALLWNLLGVAMFYLQISMTPEAIAALPAPQREVYEATPSWLNLAFAVAVFGGVFGAVGLLLRKRWAVPCFLVSLLALVVQIVSAYLVTPAWTAYGAAGLAMPVVLLAIALFLLWYARKAERNGWIA
jgi:hypothetical protein